MLCVRDREGFSSKTETFMSDVQWASLNPNTKDTSYWKPKYVFVQEEYRLEMKH